MKSSRRATEGMLAIAPDMNNSCTTYERIKAVTLGLFSYCKKNNWAGWDPYDALNSRLFELLPFLNFRIPRLVMIQSLKRSPVNMRSLLLVPKTQNPKALALFLKASIGLSVLEFQSKDVIGQLIDRIVALRSPGEPYWCWGYSFPWQTRDPLVHRDTPNLVCTTFVADALLDAYESNGGNPKHLEMAMSAADYIVNELHFTEGTSISSYCYPTPASRAQCHNANFLGAALLCRVYKHSGEEKFLDNALEVARFSASKQKADGSWDYGEHSSARWIDNFHTGYNLCALQSICEYSQVKDFKPHIRRGFDFYLKHFFRDDGAPRYFHNCTYPIDIHCVAQGIITLLTFKDLYAENVRLAEKIFNWAMVNMWDNRGYFYYQKLPSFKNKISYMRWAQAWMLLAMSMLLANFNEVKNKCGNEIKQKEVLN